MISEESIQRVKDAADIVDTIGSVVKLKKHGKDSLGLCPFHAEKSPSFTVSPTKGIYKCFGCGKSGDTISFLIDHEKLSYLDAIAWLAKRYSIELEEYQKKDFVKPPKRLEKLGAKSLKWFEETRMISNNTLLRFDITEALEFMPQLGQEVTAICFNYFRDGELINTKFRGPKKSFKLAKGAELIFYNLDAIKGEKTCIIVEGEIDALSMYEAGVFNVVSVPNGAAKGSQRLEYLDNCWSYFTNMDTVILAVDNDGPGDILKTELARRLGMEKCRQVVFPEDCKDANDVLVKHGKKALAQVVEAATELPLEGITTLDDVFEEVKDYYENGYPMGVKAKIPGLDELISFYPGQLTVVTGMPGSGKSEFVDLIMTSLTRYHNWSWGVCSFENPPAFHITKLAEKFTDRSFAFRKDPEHRISPKQFDYAMGMIDKYFNFMNISLVNITMDGLLKKAEELVKRKGINGLLFDPWNCIEHKYSDESETKYVLTCLNKLIAFLEKYKVHGFLLAHPTKLNKNPSTKKYDVPTMYNISGSAHFFNRTHNGMSIYRDFQTGMVDVHVQKVKWSWLGKLGFCSFDYNTFTRAYIPSGGSEMPELPLGNWTPVVNLPYPDD